MKEQGKYYLAQYTGNHYRHGGVGYTDAERIAAAMGYQALSLPRTGLLAPVRRLWTAWQLIRQLQRGDILFVIYPVYGRADRWLLRKCKTKGVRLVTLVADIDGLKDESEPQLAADIAFLQLFDAFIVHGQPMENWVKTMVKDAPVTQLEFFDFLAPVNHSARQLQPAIVFAGNLAKSPFLAQLNSHIFSSLHFILYGAGVQAAWLKEGQVEWEGQKEPAELPMQLKGAFGLVWDGLEPTGGEGELGRYMRYISHHKLSLYILAGLPVIVWKQAGSAAMVERYGIGMTVDSMEEIPAAIKKLSGESYQKMRDQLIPLAQRISKGEGLQHALQTLLSSDH